MPAKVEKRENQSVDTAEFEADLMRLYGGPIIGGVELASALGFRSNIAFQRAARRGAIPLPLFRMEGRRGVFVLVKDLARYLLLRRAVSEEARQSDKTSSKTEGRDRRD